jgi:hypothetical protein
MVGEELKEIIKESIREVLKEERFSLYEILIPYASRRELSEIQKRFGSPKKYNQKDFVDMTAWIKG